MTEYTFNTHKHYFAVWTAARAVSRGFTGTINVDSAISSTDMRSFAENGKQVTPEIFEVLHRKICRKLIASFLKLEKKCSYGQAAKIMAVYLKTSVIIGSGCRDPRCSIIHPPIDRILLKSLKGYPAARKINWTQLTETKYWHFVAELQSVYKNVDWQLEKDWHPKLSAQK